VAARSPSSWILAGAQLLLLAGVALLWREARSARADQAERGRALESRLGELERQQRLTTLAVAGAAAPAAAPRCPPDAGGRRAEVELPGERGSSGAAQRPPAAGGPEVEARIREAREIAAGAISRGLLRRDDVLALRQLAVEEPRFQAIRDDLFAAINAQRVTPEDLAFIVF